MPRSAPIKTLILCLAEPSGNPRPNRMVHLCHEMGHVVSLASPTPKSPLPYNALYEFSPPSMNMIDRIIRKLTSIISLPLPFVREYFLDRDRGLSRVRDMLKGRKFDLIIVEDLDLLAFAFSLRSSAKVVFDAREYYPKQFEENFLWQLADQSRNQRLCARYMPLCDTVMTVSPGLRAAYKEYFGIDALLVRSMPSYRPVPYKALSDDMVRMVHHGKANRNRKLENMIALFADIDARFTLDFYLTGSAAYIGKLKDMAKGNAAIRFRDPVSFDGIVPMLQTYDLGLYLLEPTGFNTEFSLPNKFFEFIQAGLGVAIGPSPDMADLVSQYQCGVVSPDFSPQSMATCLNALTRADVAAMKQASIAAARELCFEKEAEKIKAMFSELLPCA